MKLFPKAFRVRLCGLEYLPDFVYMLSEITKERVTDTLSLSRIASLVMICGQVPTATTTNNQLSISLLAQALKKQLISLPDGARLRAC